MRVESKTGACIFCCYSWKDEELAHEIKTHLSVLRREGLIAAWYDRRIEESFEGGEDALLEIDKAQVILLVISPDFVASDYSSSTEMQRVMQRHEAGEAYVIPILLYPVSLEGAPFEKLQQFPLNGKPIIEWSDPNEAFYLIARTIRRVIKNSVPERETSNTVPFVPPTSQGTLALESGDSTKDRSTLDGLQDEVLVMRAEAGDQDAFGTLFLRYKAEIYACLISIVGSNEIAKDLWQDTYITAWSRIQSLKEPSRFKAWLFTLARHLARDWLSSTHHEKTDLTEDPEDDENSRPLATRKVDPEAVIEQDYILSVLAGMEPALREVLLLNANGYSRAEIAQQLGYRESTVTTYLAMARKRFRELYNKAR